MVEWHELGRCNRYNSLKYNNMNIKLNEININTDDKDICTGVNSNRTHQLQRKDKDTSNKYNIYPLTYIQAVYDAKTNERLDTILYKCNNVYLPWKGSVEATRIQLPFWMRRKGIIISYKNNDDVVITEKLVYDDCLADEFFSLDSSWIKITDALPIGGNITIGPNGNWYQDGMDTGFKAQGPKGDNGLTPHLKLENSYVWYSYDNKQWYDLFPLIDITPGVKVGTVTTLAAGSKATVKNVSTDKNAIFDFGIPMGNTGAKGPKGDGYQLKGWVDTASQLPTTGTIGDTYAVGTATPYDLYIWKNSTSKWVNVGNITEVKASIFDGGRADSKYGGTRTIDCGGADAFVTNSQE